MAESRSESRKPGGEAAVPPEILDYVVVHELAHRKEMNHSSKFWAIVEQEMPDYQERKQRLKELGGQFI